MHGQKAAVGINLNVGRRGRSTVSVRVVGRSSVAWVDAAFLWGAKLEAVVMDNGELNEHLRSMTTVHYHQSP